MDEIEQFEKIGEVLLAIEGKVFFYCTLCDERFKGYNSYADHLKKLHLFVKKANKIERLKKLQKSKRNQSFSEKSTSSKCHVCKREFTRNEHLLRHLAVIHKIDKSDAENGVKEPGEVDSLLSSSNLLNENIENLLDYNQLESCSGAEDDKPLARLQQPPDSNNKFLGIFVECQPDMNKEFITKDTKKVENDTLGDISDSILDNEKIDKYEKLPSSLDKYSIGTKETKCDECDKSFSNDSQFQRHNHTKHNDKKHKCPICEKSFTTNVYLQRHITTHEKKQFFCKECTEKFSTKEELKTHVKAEGHDRPLLCPECGLRCKTSNILMVHIRRHRNEKPFKCKFCSKGFPRMDDLRIHEKYHTGEKSHFCTTCGKGFQRKYNLTIHLRVHTGEKPYKCPHCPQAFAQGNDLKAHIRRHTGERFRCEICGAAFLQGYQIRQHKFNEHGIQQDPPTQRVAKFTLAEAQKLQIKQNSQNEVLSPSSGKSSESTETIKSELPLEMKQTEISMCDDSTLEFQELQNFLN